MPGGEERLRYTVSTMQQFLFIAEIPPSDAMSTGSTYSSGWRSFAQESSSSTKSTKGVTRIREGSWLLAADGAWSILHSLASAADRWKIPYSVLLIEGEVTPVTKP